MATFLRPDGSVDIELSVFMHRYEYGVAALTITPKLGTGYASRAWLLEHVNGGRRNYEEPYFDDDPADRYPQASCRACHVAVTNIGEPMCSRCVEKFKMCKRCRFNQLYLDWDHYDLEMCKGCLIMERGACERCERPALKGSSRCHAHADGDAVKISQDRFWAADFSIMEECPVRPKIVI